MTLHTATPSQSNHLAGTFGGQIAFLTWANWNKQAAPFGFVTNIASALVINNTFGPFPFGYTL